MGDPVLDALDEETRDSLDEAALENGRVLFAHETEFVMGAVSLDALPQAGLPEIAFAGRSNSGKSSVINALTGQKRLAKISKTPGRTQLINFFDGVSCHVT